MLCHDLQELVPCCKIVSDPWLQACQCSHASLRPPQAHDQEVLALHKPPVSLPVRVLRPLISTGLGQVAHMGVLCPTDASRGPSPDPEGKRLPGPGQYQPLLSLGKLSQHETYGAPKFGTDERPCNKTLGGRCAHPAQHLPSWKPWGALRNSLRRYCTEGKGEWHAQPAGRPHLATD